MKTAIIGASMPGLACAYALEQSGISYELFDKQHISGEILHFASALVHPSGSSWFDRFTSDTGIPVRPVAPIRRIIVNTPQGQKEYMGDLGWIMEHGQGKDKVSGQIDALLKQEIRFNTLIDWEFMLKTYDRIAVCGPAGALSGKQGDFISQYPVFIRGIIVLGDFQENTVFVANNLDFCPGGFFYKIPLGKNKAFFALCMTGITPKQLANYWEKLLVLEDMRLEIIESFEYVHEAGYLRSCTGHKTWYAELGTGFHDPFFGSSQISAIESGYLAGLSIATGMDLNRAVLGKPYLNLLSPAVSPLSLLEPNAADPRKELVP